MCLKDKERYSCHLLCCHDYNNSSLCLSLLPSTFIATIYEYRGSKQRMLSAVEEEETAYANSFVTFALLRQQPQSIMDKHTHVPSINNDGLFMNLAKCFMNLYF